MQRWPLLTGDSMTGFTCTTWPSRTPTLSSQPTAQYPQTLRVQLSARPRSSRDLSTSAPVGQVSTQAPQPVQELSIRLVMESGTIRPSSARPTGCQTDRPWTSSQMRTQRLHWMHWDMSTWI